MNNTTASNMSHDLSALISAIITEEIIGDRNIVITGLTSDSRAVQPGAMFVAVRGASTDGHRFIDSAVAAGAAAIVAEELPASPAANVTWIKVGDSSTALGMLASRWWGDPSRRLTLVGVTGTNGKTTVAKLLYEMARLDGQHAGLLSTVVNKIDTTDVPATHTTPDPLSLNRLLHDMVEAGCTFAAMEVSSHAAAQRRIAGLHFAGGVFTNLTRDHLDYHKTFAAYLEAKKSFFDMLPPSAFALVNADDRNGAVMLQNTMARRKATYSLRSLADYRCSVVKNRIDGMLLEVDGTEVETMFSGRFNACNLLAVYAAARLLGMERMRALTCLSSLVPVAGRFQAFRSDKGVTAIVDYAHTPDALVNVLDTIRDITGRQARVITVTGAGGNRDHGKRPIMAAEAARRSDTLVLTADNPRDEDPSDIIDQMAAGIDADTPCRVLTIPSRRQAITTAIGLAAPGDVVLIAGKGHETYQEIKGVRHHFDDREEARSALGLTSETNRQ